MYYIIIELKGINILISFAMANLILLYIVQTKTFVVQVSLLYKLKCSIFQVIENIFSNDQYLKQENTILYVLVSKCLVLNPGW